ncbi:MAG TPA: GNAT family N-acetyltransferase [Armatimonadota bacterium]|nr:GNAT family N-acetyltransferase [Armatimonadota bacterium]
MSIEIRPCDRGHEVRYMLGGEPVSSLCICDLRMHIGTARLRTAGIADVQTKESHRRRGFARQVLERALVFMRRQEYDLAVLFGISDFYPRWGYAPICGSTRVTLATKEAARAPATLAVRRLRRDEMELTLELYRRNNALRTGAVVRRAGKWPGFIRGSRPDRRVNVYGAFQRRRLLGYVALDREPGEPVIIEVGYRQPEVFSALLAAAARQARRAKAEQIHVQAPLDHPFVEWCRQYTCQVSTHYVRAGGAMGRIISLRGCFSRLAPELTRRLRASCVNWSGRLEVATDIGAVTLHIEPGALTLGETPKPRVAPDAALDIGQALLTQLIFGYRSAADALAWGGASLRGGPVQLLEALFPPGAAHICHADRF